MILSKREKWALWSMLEFIINRYLMSNAIQRLDAGEKVQRHIEMSKIIAQFIFTCDEHSFEVNKSWLAIHDYLAEILTNKMDEVIEFPVNEPLYGKEVFDILAKRFFNIIIKNFNQIEVIAKQCLKGEHINGK